MAREWPEIDERAVMTLACCGEQLSTRVESVEGDNCVVHLPVHECLQPNREAPDNVLVWFSADHCWIRPVSIAGFAGYPRAALWVLEANGPSERWERRDFIRASTDLEMLVYKDGEVICEIRAIDLSEGGIRALVPCDPIQEFPPNIELEFTLGDQIFRTSAQLAWSSCYDDEEGESADAGFEFQGISATDAEYIRKFVLRMQIDARRKRLAAA